MSYATRDRVAVETPGPGGSTYRNPDLPPVLRFLDGGAVHAPPDWASRRAEIARLWQETYLGSFPETPPPPVEVEVLGEAPGNGPGSGTRRALRLTFDTPGTPDFGRAGKPRPALPRG